MKYLLIFKILLLTVLFYQSSCVSNETANSDTVKQSEIYQSYFVTFDSGEKEISATACFRFGGSTGTSLALVKPSMVTFNGTEMNADKNVFSGTYYEANIQTTYPPSEFVFKYTDNDKKIYINGGFVYTIAIESYPENISKDKGFEIQWAGNPVQEGEEVMVTLSGNDFFSISQATSVVGAQSIGFPREVLKDAKTGDVDIVVKRTKRVNLQYATHLGGQFYITYISKKVSSTIL